MRARILLAAAAAGVLSGCQFLSGLNGVTETGGAGTSSGTKSTGSTTTHGTTTATTATGTCGGPMASNCAPSMGTGACEVDCAGMCTTSPNIVCGMTGTCEIDCLTSQDPPMMTTGSMMSMPPTNPCQSKTIQCPPDRPCSVVCYGFGACSNTTINCNANQPCRIECNAGGCAGTNSPNPTTVNCDGMQPCLVTCGSKGSQAPKVARTASNSCQPDPVSQGCM